MSRRFLSLSFVAGLELAFLALLCPVMQAQQTPQALSLKDLQATPARAWTVDAARNELAVVDFKGSYLRYRLRTVNDRGDQTRDLIESTDGPVARLILRDGHALTAEQNTDEEARLHSMLNDPGAFRKHVHEDGNAKRTAADLIRMLPDAMLYTYAPNQPQRPGVPDTEVALDFEPNPAWSPPTTISEALTGLRGRIWIDARTRRMTHLECSIFRSINIGFGVLAHVNPGGTFSVDQAEVVPGQPLVTRFMEHVSLRALVVKSIRENSDVTASQFQPVEAMTYAEAIHRLLQTPLPR